MASGTSSSEPGPEVRAAIPDSREGGIRDAGDDATTDVVVGQVVRPFGRRGEVFVQPLTDDPGRFLEIANAEVGPSGRPGTRRSLDSVRIHKGRPVILFEGMSDISSAETLRGMEVRIPDAERAPLPEGRYYSDQLVGCKAESEEGVHLGEIVDTLDTAGPTLLVLRGPDGSEDLIPFVEALCVLVEPPTGKTTGRVVLNIPQGLLGLNNPTDSNAR